MKLVVMVLFQEHVFTLALRFTAVDVSSGVVSEVFVFALAPGFYVVDPGTESGAVERVALDEEVWADQSGAVGSSEGLGSTVSFVLEVASRLVALGCSVISVGVDIVVLFVSGFSLYHVGWSGGWVLDVVVCTC
jgi:hypothetical protein